MVNTTNDQPIGDGRTQWTAQEHMMLYGPNFNDGMASYIVNTIRPASVLEFGCGLGLYCAFLKQQLGISKVYGIEPNPMGGVFDAPGGPVQLAINIFDDMYPDTLKNQFELVLSIEVAEHIPRNKHDLLFDFLVARASNWIVFSGARVGQGGVGHIAERPEHEWREELVNRGMHFKDDLTRQIRAASNERNINHRRNVMVFNKTG